MKGHMQDGKFHPHTQYKGVRKSRDQKAKTQGIRMQRERTTKSELQDEINNFNRKSTTKIEYGDVGGHVKGLKVKGAGALIKIMTMKEAVNCLKFSSWILDRQMESTRQKRDPEIKGKKLPKEVIQGAREYLGGTDIEVERYNPKWKLYEVYVDSDRYYFFPDEDSAIAFGRQSIRDTASEYIPEKGSPQRDEYINLSEDELVEKIMEEQSGYGQRSELGAVAQSVAGYDGEYSELPQGWIAFRID